MSQGVLVALSDATEQMLVRQIQTVDDLTVTRRCADVQELLAAAIAQVGTIAVTDLDAGIDRVLIDRLTRAGVRTLVVTPPPDHARVAQLGGHPVDPDADLVAAIRELAQSEPAVPQVPAPQVPPVVEAAGSAAGSTVVTVTGAPGSPGRSTIAVHLADELARSGSAVLLIDADIWGSALAQMLGVLSDSAGLAAAVRAADHGTLGTDQLGRLAPEISPGLRLLTGLPRAGRWREIGAASVESMLDVARTLAPWVVIDAPVLVPDDDAEYAPTMAARRNAVAEVVQAGADHVLVVGAAEPVGIERLVHTVLDNEPAPARTVVVNRVRAGAAGPRPQDSVREALARFAGITDAVLIPDDRAAADRALLTASTWAQVAPKSPARAAVQDLAHRLGGQVPARTGVLARLRRAR